MVKQKLKSYSLQFKLNVANEYKPNVSGYGYHALAKQYGVTPSMVRQWYKIRNQLEIAAKDRQCATRSLYRLPRAGRKPERHDLERQLHEWIVDKNKKGSRVKDRYIQLQALNRHRTIESETAQPPADFRASSGWLDRFKDRYTLGSRGQTTTRTLPDNARDTCLQFNKKSQQLIKEHNIQPCNVINMDQVPRYFETEPKLAITTRGSREVLLRKGGSSHKRFTATFAITSDGQLLTPHVLFSTLKNRPACPPGSLVDVNPTALVGVAARNRVSGLCR